MVSSQRVISGRDRLRFVEKGCQPKTHDHEGYTYGLSDYDSLGEMINPRHAAVCVVDMQNDFCAKGGHMSRTHGKEGGVAKRERYYPAG